MAASIGTDSDLPGIENGGGEPGNTTGGFPTVRRLKRARESDDSVGGGAMRFAGVRSLFAFAIRFPAMMGARKILAPWLGWYHQRKLSPTDING